MFPVSIKRHLKTRYGSTIQLAGYISGVMALSAFITNSRGAIILMYHSVADSAVSRWIDPANHVPADIFEEQIDFLSNHRRVVSLSELLRLEKEEKSLSGNLVVLTFDDGYRDNLTIAAPILDRYNLSATLFLPTGYIDREETQWIDQLYSLFKYRTRHRLDWGDDQVQSIHLLDPMQVENAYAMIREQLIAARSAERVKLLNRLRNELCPEVFPPRLTMNWEDVRTLLSNYRCFTLGGHTLEHSDLTRFSDSEVEYEINGCRERIRQETGNDTGLFSFCYGRTSEKLRNLIAESGFEAACGGGSDPIIRKGIDRYCLPRVAAPGSMKRFRILTSSRNTGVWRRLGQ